MTATQPRTGVLHVITGDVGRWRTWLARHNLDPAAYPRLDNPLDAAFLAPGSTVLVFDGLTLSEQWRQQLHRVGAHVVEGGQDTVPARAVTNAAVHNLHSSSNRWVEVGWTGEVPSIEEPQADGTDLAEETPEGPNGRSTGHVFTALHDLSAALDQYQAVTGRHTILESFKVDRGRITLKVTSRVNPTDHR